MKYIAIGIRVLLTIAFVGAATAKLMGVDMMVQSFDVIGVGQWFRYLTALIELTGAVMLWVSTTRVLGALLLGGTMVGAIVAHFTVLGPSAVPATVLGLLAAAVIYLERKGPVNAKVTP